MKLCNSPGWRFGGISIIYGHPQIRSAATAADDSYARHWHILTAPAHDYRDASILNLHVPTGKTWIQWLPLQHSQKFVKAAVEAYQSKLLFPVPGAHCSSCPSQACLNEAIV